jgi:hypothetical protein
MRARVVNDAPCGSARNSTSSSARSQIRVKFLIMGYAIAYLPLAAGHTPSGGMSPRRHLDGEMHLALGIGQISVASGKFCKSR